MPSKLESSQQFSDDPKGWAERWGMEISASRESLTKWHKDGDTTVERFLDKREPKTIKESRLGLFMANTQTMRSLLFGKIPSVDVSRRFADSSDDVARVASEMTERMLNTDIERETDGFEDALLLALSDRLLPGLGNVRVRYTVKMGEIPEVPAIVHPKTGQELAPAIPAQQVKIDEDVEVIYVYWKDQLWSPARVFSEVRWWAFLTQMTREALVKRFGKDIGNRVPLNSKRSPKGHGDPEMDATRADPWARAEVWEIWDKEHKEVFWFVEGFGEILDRAPDPLGLEGFWPFPKPLIANWTTSAFIPRSDYMIAKNLYEEIDVLCTRISLLEKAIKVVGVYDKSNPAVRRLLSDAAENDLVPVDNWAMFAEKGGIHGAIDWLPIEQIVAALDKLAVRLQDKIALLYQVTGMSDIMRGQAVQASTATEQAIKARFASVRVQSFQDEFARFASNVQKIKKEVIAKHFDANTIIERSNIMFTPDASLAEDAVKLLKSRHSDFRVAVKPESISLTDYAALKQERVEWVNALSTFLQSAIPMIQLVPQSMPYLLQCLQWALAGFKGASTIEGVLDQAIASAQKEAKARQAEAQRSGGKSRPPDPKVVAAQVKSKADQEKTLLEHKADMARIGAETQSQIAIDRNKFQLDVAAEERKQHALGMAALMNQQASSGVTPMMGR